jgi:hypothetical protein
VCCGGFVWRAAAGVKGLLAPALRVLAVLLVLDLAPRTRSTVPFYWAHVVVSEALFVHELTIAIGLALALRNTCIDALLARLFAAGLIAMFSQLHVIAYLSVGIVAYQFAFGALLVVAPDSSVGAPFPRGAREG